MVVMRKDRHWLWPWELKRMGILGINRRNLEFLFPCNPRRSYPQVDNKVITKQVCKDNGISIPETYRIISRYGDIKFAWQGLEDLNRAVIKPAHGAGGKGVLLLRSIQGTEFRTPDGWSLTESDINYHIAGILSGLFSLGGQPDVAIVEQFIDLHPVFKGVIPYGMPDIRIITHKYKPVMAMLRLPSDASKGRANLHQGGVGAGIDMHKGTTFRAIHYGDTITRHPDTGVGIIGIDIPHWSRCLELAARFSRVVEMGYVGIDIVIDAVQGPILLEANARPGLAIQLANGQGLLQKLRE